MFDIGFSELIVIIIVSCIFLKPEDLPKILYHIRNFFRKIDDLKTEATKFVTKLDENNELKKLQKDVDEIINNSAHKIIYDSDGNSYPAYDLFDIKPDIKKDR